MAASASSIIRVLTLAFFWGNIRLGSNCRPFTSSVYEHCLSGISDLKIENTKSQVPKHRGRGTFSYEKRELYSDQLLYM
ncbi:hypothetical protein K1719_043346 [Acacia pycnantha]|nr:hypothetical protein K1719_043346 [Acacia pycnantha]